MSSWLSHPLAAVIGLVFGGVLGWLRGKRPTKVDLTIQFKREKDDDAG